MSALLEAEQPCHELPTAAVHANTLPAPALPSPQHSAAPSSARGHRTAATHIFLATSVSLNCSFTIAAAGPERLHAGPGPGRGGQSGLRPQRPLPVPPL